MRLMLFTVIISKFMLAQNTTQMKKYIRQYTPQNIYYAFIPWAKEVLAKRKANSSFVSDLKSIVRKTHGHQFETLPDNFLKFVKLDDFFYLLAKKYLKQKKSALALKELKKIRSSSDIYPLAKHLEGVAYNIRGEYLKGINSFQDCVNSDNNGLSDKEFRLNKDSCLLNLARSLYAQRKYKKAELKYLDIPKSSPVWPYVLLDEAWNSYYLGNYNRSLGKVVTYKAPIFEPFFNPEYFVLEALSYYKMCLYEDANQVSTNFQRSFLNSTRKVRVFLKNKGKNYIYFYKLFKDHLAGKRSSISLLNTMLESLKTDLVFEKLNQGLKEAISEIRKINSLSDRSLRRRLAINLKDVIRTQKIIIGSKVRTRLIAKYADLYRAFEGMSYIKLDILAQRKKRLYDTNPVQKKKRGKIQYLKRNEKQYFWNFNGEFWADELGDYVFALRSEC